MYAVIRAGGKQYRVAPGDVIKVETMPAENGTVQFGDVLAVSGSEGQVGRPQQEARVLGTVVEEGRGDKILVFHYKRKKQYKKLRGHRQNFTAVRITEIAFDGQSFRAEEPPAKPAKKARPATSPAPEAADVTATPDQGAKVSRTKKGAVARKSVAKKSVAKKKKSAAPKKSPKKK